MNKRLALTLCVLIMSEHNKTACEKYETSIDLDASSIDASIDDLKKPLSTLVIKYLLQHIADDKDREYTVLISCKVDDQNGKVVAKLDLDQFSGEKFYAALNYVFGFSENLTVCLCDKVRSLVMKTTGFKFLYL